MDWMHPLSGLLVGLMVGLTGVGGGSLMAPIMILLLGVAPTTAVGTDLWFAAMTKAVGGAVHNRQGHTDWQIVRRLCWGSLPAAVATLWFLSGSAPHPASDGFISHLLGGILIVTAFVTLLHRRIAGMATAFEGRHIATLRRLLPGLTIAAGAVLGAVVTLTSVGAGALGATLLVMLYPYRMTPQKVVGTDIVHAVPLTLLAGFGHFWMGNVDFALLGSLLLGSIPGIVAGARLAGRVSPLVLRGLLAAMLLVSGWRLLG